MRTCCSSDLGKGDRTNRHEAWKVLKYEIIWGHFVGRLKLKRSQPRRKKVKTLLAGLSSTRRRLPTPLFATERVRCYDNSPLSKDLPSRFKNDTLSHQNPLHMEHRSFLNFSLRKERAKRGIETNR